MRLNVIEMENDEGIHYNQGVFKQYEDLIIFPMHEFMDFYQEMEHRLTCIKNIIDEKSDTNPAEAIDFLGPHLEILSSEVGELMDFNVQTTLESYIKSGEKSHKKISGPQKEEIQCLIGL
jgi:hypothetical protein